MKLPKLFRTALYLSIFVSGLAFLTAIPAFAESTGGIGGRPANPDPNNPRTQSIFIYSLDKDQSKTDQVLVSNGSDTAQTINLYAVDGIVTNTGAYTCQQEVEASTGVGSWINISQTQVTIAPHENTKIDFTITVPATADVGEHDGCLVFQSADDQGQVTGNVRVRTRQAIRVVETVPGTLQRSVAINQFAVDQKNGLQQFQLDVENKGNVSADINADITLRSVFGHVIYKNGGGYPVLSNKKLSLNFVNNDQPFFGGWYVAGATVSYDTRAGTFGTDDASHLVMKSAKDIVIFIAPSLLAIILYILILIIVIGGITWLIVRRYRHTHARRTWKEIVVTDKDDINDLATHYNISWKKIASVNNIRAPYVLEPGTKVKVPVVPKKSRQSNKKAQ